MNRFKVQNETVNFPEIAINECKYKYDIDDTTMKGS